MPLRRSFDCLWCGRPWEVRADEDLEGWAALCPECLGRADDNGFLRSRVRIALRDRSAASAGLAPAVEAVPPAPGDPPPPPGDPPPAPGDWEDWYLRRGRFARGPVHDGPWSMELDEATRWLDGLPLSGVIVELGAGMGWWTALLAEKGELWLYDSDGPSLDAARKRLMAHGLLAHLHQRDVLAAPDKTVDAVFAAYLLGAGAPDMLDARIAAAAAWLKPGGAFVFLEAGPGPPAPLHGPAGPLWPQEPNVLRERLAAAGLSAVEVGGTSRAFVWGRAQAAP